jgi:hypothetical protein
LKYKILLTKLSALLKNLTPFGCSHCQINLPNHQCRDAF